MFISVVGIKLHSMFVAQDGYQIEWEEVSEGVIKMLHW